MWHRTQQPRSVQTPPGSESFPRDATRQEIETLIHEVDQVPAAAWLLACTGAAALLARYGITVAWQNYLQNPRHGRDLPGGLGLGEAKATTIQNAFLFFQYLAPTPFALLSDALIGRHKTMLICLALVLPGYFVLLTTSIPSALDHGAGIPGIAIAMILTGLGHGGLSAVMYPFIADQVPDKRPQVRRNKHGELIVTDRKLTIQYVFNGYYWMVNVTALFSIPTTILERQVDFWAAYLLPTALLVIAIVPVILFNGRLVRLPPQGNAITHASQVLWIACCSGFRLSAALPAEQNQRHHGTGLWTADFVNEIRRALQGCRVIVWFVIFWLCYNQTTNNIISQAGQMELYGVSNDTIQALNPIFCIILGPVIQGLIFPLLRRFRVPHGPIVRISVAFLFISASLAYAAGLQHFIYSSGPCYDYPLDCQALPDGTSRPNEINMWLQAPFHFLLAIGEILRLVALNGYIYSEAPSSLKSVVQAFQGLTAAVGSALGIALGPVSKNPYLVILFASLSGIMTASAILVWILFRKSDAVYEKRDAG